MYAKRLLETIKKDLRYSQSGGLKDLFQKLIHSSSKAEKLIAEYTDDFPMWARKCDVTGEGMNEGWYAEGCGMYFANEEDALQWCIENDYKDLKEAYADGSIYWTSWHDDDEDWLYVQTPDGELVMLDDY